MRREEIPSRRLDDSLLASSTEQIGRALTRLPPALPQNLRREFL